CRARATARSPRNWCATPCTSAAAWRWLRKRKAERQYPQRGDRIMEMAQEAILVTGGASGIGLAVARGLLDAGRKVLVADVSQERLDEIREMAPAGRRGCVRLDVSDEAEVMDAMARLERDFGPISGLVNSAGIGRDVPFLDTDAAMLRRILEVN